MKPMNLDELIALLQDMKTRHAGTTPVVVVKEETFEHVLLRKIDVVAFKDDTGFVCIGIWQECQS